MATVHEKCLVEREKALHLYNKIFCVCVREIHITFIAIVIVYCYNCSILLFIIVVNLSLCLIY